MREVIHLSAGAHTHPYTHTEKYVIIAFPRQQWFSDGDLMSRDTDIACQVKFLSDWADALLYLEIMVKNTDNYAECVCYMERINDYSFSFLTQIIVFTEQPSWSLTPEVERRKLSYNFL
jgi:hypothetical protein